MIGFLKEIKVGKIRLFGDVYEIGVDIGWFPMAFFIAFAMVNYASEVFGAPAFSAKSLTFGFLAMAFIYGSVLIHEFCHAIVGNKSGIPMNKIVFWALGLVAIMSGQARKSSQEFKIAIVGPLSSLAIAALLAGALSIFQLPVNSYVARLILLIRDANIMLAVFNSLPIFPMDGGRILRSIVWGLTKNKIRGTKFAVAAAYVCAALMFIYGAWSGLLMLCVFAVFLFFSASGELIALKQEKKLSSFAVKDVMAFLSEADKNLLNQEPRLVEILPVDLPLDEAMRIMEEKHIVTMPVGKNGEIVGVARLSDIYEKLREVMEK